MLGRAWTPWGGEGAPRASSVKQTFPTPLTRIDHTLEYDTPSSSNHALDGGALHCSLHKDGAGIGLLPALPAHCCFLASCHPSQTPHRGGLSSCLFVGHHGQKCRGSMSRALAVSLGFEIVLNLGFGILWWHWGLCLRSCQGKDRCGCSDTRFGFSRVRRSC